MTSWNSNTPLIHSTPLLNIVPNGGGFRVSCDMFNILPSFEVSVHHSDIYSPSISMTAISSVLIRSLYDWSQGKKYPRFGLVSKYTINSCLSINMQLYCRMPWSKWFEHTVQNRDMNAFRYILLSSKDSLWHIPFNFFLKQLGCNKVWQTNQCHMNLDHETRCVNSLQCSDIILVHPLDIHLSSWHDLQQN